MKVLIISLSDVARDPRVLKQLAALDAVHEPIVAGYGPPPREAGYYELLYRFPFKRLPPVLRKSWAALLMLLRLQRRAERWLYSFDLDRLASASGQLDLIIANHIDAMPVALDLLNITAQAAVPIYLDLHEFAPEEGKRLVDRVLLNRFKASLCTKYLPRAQALSTVSEGLASAYQSLAGRKVHVVPNVPPYESLAPQPVAMGAPIRLVYHGGFGRNRDLDGLVDALRLLGAGYELHFYLVGNPRAVAGLRRKAEGVPVFFHAPVGVHDIAREINRYDIGVYLLPAGVTNSDFAMPNKLYEYVQGRLAVVTSPNPEVREFIERHRIGRVAHECSGVALAAALRELDRDKIHMYKHNANAIAGKYCAENYYGQLRQLFASAVGSDEKRLGPEEDEGVRGGPVFGGRA